MGECNMKIAGVTIQEPKVISADTTFYVATTGSDTTGDGSSGSPWATLRKALSYLDEYRILGSAKVTISIAKGKYTETSQVPVNHPNGDRIRIVGSTPLSRTMSSVQSVSGSSANYDIVVNVNSVADISVGDYVIFRDCANGTRPQCMFGLWPVTDVDAVNTRITVKSRQVVNSPSGAVTANLTVLQTILSFTGCSGLYMSYGARIGNRVDDIGLAYIVLEGDRTASTFGLACNGGAQVNIENSIGVYGFNINVMASGGTSTIGSQKSAVMNVSYGNTGGLYVGMGSSVNVGTILSCGNTGYGVKAYLNSVAILGAGITCGNGIGLQAVEGGVTHSDGVCAFNTYGAKAVGASYICYACFDKTGNTTDASPTADTAPGATGDYSFIDTALTPY